MAYAIMELGGRQWKVEPGTQVEINRLPSAVGATHTVDRVLLAHDGTRVRVGRPYLQGAQVVCEILAHQLGPKTISYHFRRRENWRKTVGHRQPLTRLLIKEIRLSDLSPAPAEEREGREAQPPHGHGIGKAGRAPGGMKRRTAKAGAPKTKTKTAQPAA
ncbi:MAG: 50S ribosomal protein L21 [Candidatus Omnitrophica bacterium]|nr:50S ribosomal protein L21 [Candidatus Omnitrophota bacterium]